MYQNRHFRRKHYSLILTFNKTILEPSFDYLMWNLYLLKKF